MSQGLFTKLYESRESFALIDTRERREHVNGHWFGSTNIPLSVLTPQITRLVPQHDFPIHLLDWQDTLSTVAAEQLSQLGYTRVKRCRTHHPNAFGQGFVKGEFVWSKAFGEVLAHTCGLPEITPAEYLANYKDARLFDVRPTAEYSLFTIPGSQSLPNSLLLANMQALMQTGETALLHCAGRTRSIIGACTLQAAGYSGSFAIFKGGTQAWQLDGLEREFNANRLFASESDDVQAVKDFLDKWHIDYKHVSNRRLDVFIAENNRKLMFDVSDDAATGQAATYPVIKTSGTNLIQQTDQSIARYHVPVILFDYGTGSRAAFTAYWLQLMGFTVSVVYLTEALAPFSSDKQQGITTEITQPALSADQLIKHRDAAGTIIDVRTSKSHAKCHLKGTQWHNISELLVAEQQTPMPAAVIGNSIAHANETANLLQARGWKIIGIYAWDNNVFDPDQLRTGTPDSPIDQSSLFAGRHHGNLQDSRDYLTWEEALPDQIDQSTRRQWLDLLDRTT